MSYDSSREEAIQQFKREGKFEQALTLCGEWMKSAELRAKQEGSTVESWPYWQACVILRKLKRPADEVAIIERFIAQPSSGSKQSREVIDRLPKAYLAAGLADMRTVDGHAQPIAFYAAEGVPVDERKMFVRDAVVVDCETTGLAEDDELIELGIIRFRYSHLSGRVLEVTDRFSGLREPSCPISGAASRVHGLRIADVRGYTLDMDGARRVIDGVSMVIAHNANFDHRMVTPVLPALAKLPWFCTVKSFDWKGRGCASAKLDDIAEYYDIERQSHRALGDAGAVVALLSMTDSGTGQPFLHEIIASVPLGYVSKWQSLNQQYDDVDNDDDETDDDWQDNEMVISISMPTSRPAPPASYTTPPVRKPPPAPVAPTESESFNPRYIIGMIVVLVLVIVIWTALAR